MQGRSGACRQPCLCRNVPNACPCLAQLARWEEYADEVEEQMRQLLADNATLQAALADTRSQLEATRPSSSEGAPPALGLGCVGLYPGEIEAVSPYASCS